MSDEGSNPLGAPPKPNNSPYNASNQAPTGVVGGAPPKPNSSPYNADNPAQSPSPRTESIYNPGVQTQQYDGGHVYVITDANGQQYYVNNPNPPKPTPKDDPSDDVPKGPPPGGAPLGGAPLGGAPTQPTTPTQPTQPSQGNGIGTTNPYAGANYVAYDADGNPYYIGSDRGMEFLNGAQNGSSITGADGSTWTKDANGNVVIVDVNGRTYTIPGASINATTTPVQNGQVGRLNKEDYFNNGRQYLDAQRDAAAQQIQLQKDYAVQQGVNELQRAEEDAQQQFQTQRNQVARDEQIGLDNQALYAEARGDKGGIGYAQYAAIQAQAAQNRLTINQAQTKLSTDTARQIADLRAQGEFEAADALLSLTQTYLGQLQQLYENSMAYGLDVDKFNLQLEQWEQEYGAQIASLTGTFNGAPTYAAQQDMAQAALLLLQNGYGVGDQQAAALKAIYGYDENTINNIRMQAQLAAAGVGGGYGGGGGNKTGKDTPVDYSSRRMKTADAAAQPIAYLLQQNLGGDFAAAKAALLLANSALGRAFSGQYDANGNELTLADYYAQQYVDKYRHFNSLSPEEQYMYYYDLGLVEAPILDDASVAALGWGDLTETDVGALSGQGLLGYTFDPTYGVYYVQNANPAQMPGRVGQRDHNYREEK